MMSKKDQNPEDWKEALKKIGEELEEKEQPKPIKQENEKINQQRVN